MWVLEINESKKELDLFSMCDIPILQEGPSQETGFNFVTILPWSSPAQ